MRSSLRTLCLVLLGSSFYAAACGGDEASTFPGSSSGASGGSSGDGTSSGQFGDGDGGGGGELIPLSDLFFEPASQSVVITDANPKVAQYKLRGKRTDGTVVDVPQVSVAFDRPDIATLATGKTTVDLTTRNEYAGTGKLRAVYNGKQAEATLTVTMKLADVGAGVPANAVTALDAATLPADPSVTGLSYPYDKTVFPLGLTSPLHMWTVPKNGDTYRLSVSQSNFSWSGTSVVTAPAQVRVPQQVWDRITASNKSEPLTVTLSRWDAASQTAYVSAKQSYTIVPASLRGAIYYWTTSAGGHLSRIRPGTGAAPEVLNGGKCMGCHGVSADGSTLVAVDEEKPSNDDASTSKRAWVSYDLPGATERRVSTKFGANVAVNPNGKYVVYGNQKLKLGNTSTGALIASSGLTTVQTNATYPDFARLMTPAFSPDGTKLAAVSGTGSWYHDLRNGRLMVADFNEATTTFSNGKALVAASTFPASQNAISYPSFAPDSAQIAFHVGDYPTGCDVQGCVDATTQIGAIWYQSTSGSAAIKLGVLSDPAVVTDRNVTFEPTFNPVERGGYFWVVVTSMRDWGNRVTGTANNGKKRLWVAAIDKVTGAGDPSHPAFFLEGQEETTTNMRGFWALAQCVATPPKTGGGGGACSAGFECCSGFCDRGTCVDPGQVACQPVGGSCKTTDDCCNGPTVSCVAGVCKLPPPK